MREFVYFIAIILCITGIRGECVVDGEQCCYDQDCNDVGDGYYLPPNAADYPEECLRYDLLLFWIDEVSSEKSFFQ